MQLQQKEKWFSPRCTIKEPIFYDILSGLGKCDVWAFGCVAQGGTMRGEQRSLFCWKKRTEKEAHQLKDLQLEVGVRQVEERVGD